MEVQDDGYAVPPSLQIMIEKHTSDYITKLRGCVNSNIEKIIDALENRTNFEMGFPNNNSVILTVVDDEDYKEGQRFRNCFCKCNFLEFGICRDQSEGKIHIELHDFYYVGGGPDAQDERKAMERNKKDFPPHVTMFFLCSLAQSISVPILIITDLSPKFNGSSYYTRYGYVPITDRQREIYGQEPRIVQSPYNMLIWHPCSDENVQWIENYCSGSMLECYKNLQKMDMLATLADTTCWANTNDVNVSFANEAFN